MQYRIHRYLTGAKILLFCLLLSYTTVQAQTKTHVVQSGETLFSISQKYNVDVDSVRAWNNLQSNNIEVGQQLVIARTGKNRKSSTPSISHKIKPGETLFSLSKKFDVTISEIKEWNNLEGNNLEVGESLIIYQQDAIKKTPVASDTTSKQLILKEETQPNQYYTVKSGDNLFKIARMHNMSVEQLKALNDLSGSTIRVGQRLTVKAPASSTVIASDSAAVAAQGSFKLYEIDTERSVQSILDRFSMDSLEFTALNPKVSSELVPGQEVTVLTPSDKIYKNPYRVDANLKSLGDVSVSTYPDDAKGEATTSGELYNPKALTAAHATIALGSTIFIKNPENNHGIYVLINDRISSDGIKLSEKAFKQLQFSHQSAASVKIYKNK